MAEPIRVAIVDDSVVVRGLLSRWLSETPGLQVCGIYRSAADAVRGVAEVRPDVLLLDLEMPEMDGLTALPVLLRHAPLMRVLIVSSHSIRGADITLRCLLRGATDYVAKPSSLGEFSTSAEFRSELVARIRSICAAPADMPDADSRASRKLTQPEKDADAPKRFMSMPGPARFSPRLVEPSAVYKLRPPSLATPDVMLIAASTGGPAAMARLFESMRPLEALPPIVVVQHMSAVFTALLARHLARRVGIEAVEVSGGERLRPGVVHICQGGRNLMVEQDGFHFRIGLGRTGHGPNSPSADMLFESAASACGAGALALVLTGMGEDGLLGSQAIASAGGTVIAQDSASSVVWGMPGAVARAGLCSAVGTPAELARYALSVSAGYRT